MNKGFSLIELMIVVAIVGILAAIAYPSYQQNMIDSRRAKAAGCLMELQQFMEKFYSTNFRYDQDAGGAAVVLPAPQCVTDLAGFYGFENGGAPAAVGQQTFMLTATAAGPQLNDSRGCGNLTINQAGTKGISGGGTVAGCWRQ
ncbi:MAG TPA: type IV pilin protein [Chromatiales bacterium]|nr:type IV pilin protein [Thiotrichales bacterium]HIP69323.1 type IV pilin protein [Chromatiales bacterium]